MSQDNINILRAFTQNLDVNYIIRNKLFKILK